MAQGRKVLRCIRCGSPLQTTDPKQRGYISPDVFNNQKGVTAIYCDDCYNAIVSINNRIESSNDDEAIISYFKGLDKKSSFIVLVLDLFTFSGILDEEIVDVLRGIDFIVIGTKKKLFGSSFKEEKVKEFIKGSFAYYGIQPMKIFCIDQKNVSLDQTIDEFNRRFMNNGEFNNRNVFMIGKHNSGKSVIINAFLKLYSNQSNENISVEWLNGKLKAMIIPLGSGRKFHELPDLSDNTSILSKVEKPIQNFLIPKGGLETHSGSLKGGESVCIGSIAGVQVTEGESTYYKFYCADPVETKKVSIDKFTEAFKNNMNTKLVRPVSNSLISLLDFEIFEFKFEKDNIYHEIAAEGLGFMTFKGVGQTIRVVIPKGVYVSDNLGRI